MKNNKIKQIIKSPFIKNVTIMSSGAAAAQLVTLILSPIITRLYGPEAFGIMGTFTAIMNIIIPIAALTYPIAIVLPREDKDAKGLVRISVIITVFISLMTLLIILLFRSQIISVFNLNEISSYLLLIPLVIMFSGLMQTAEQWLIRTKQFLINAKVTFYQSLIINGGKAGIGFIHPTATILVFLTALGNGLRALLMIIFARSLSKEKKENNIIVCCKNKSLLQLAKEYYDFPIFRAPETFINAISQGLPVLMLTAFFGPASAGLYTIGRTTLRLPGRLVGKSVGDVFYPRISEAVNNKENITNIIKKATLLLGLIGIVPFGIVILFGPYLFSFVFGNDWLVAGEYARWIALWTFVGFINRPSVRSLPVLNAQRFHLFYTVLMLIVRVIALALGYYLFKSDLIAVAFFGISGAFLNAGLIVITLKISKKKLGVVPR